MKPKQFTSLIIISVIVLAASVISACRGISGNQTVKIVEQDKRIFLQPGGPHKNTRQLADFRLEYEYRKNGPKFGITGNLEFTGGVSHFASITWFHLQACFFDDTGRVLECKRICSASYRQPMEVLTFNRQVMLPENTAGMAFRYHGQVRDLGNDDPADWTFWDSPW